MRRGVVAGKNAGRPVVGAEASPCAGAIGRSGLRKRRLRFMTECRQSS